MMALLLVLACAEPDPLPTDSAPRDEDGDGFTAPEDCDDSEPRAAPGREELCDGRDNDCDGQVDNLPVDGLTLYADEDRDGYGDPAQPTRGCAVLPGTADNADDCDDANPDASPSAAERADNGLDDDCDGQVDEA